MLTQVLDRGLREGKGISGSTVYVGVAGIALGYLRLYECCNRLRPGEVQAQEIPLSSWTGPTPSQQASMYLEGAAAMIDAARTSQALLSILQRDVCTELVCGLKCWSCVRLQRLTFHEGQAGILAVRAAILHAKGDTRNALTEAEARY